MDIPQYATEKCEVLHNSSVFFFPPKGIIMSKELNIIDTLAIEQSEVAFTSELIRLDDLSLALVGGGSGLVDLG